LLALEYNVPMLVIGTPRVGLPLRFHITLEDVILPEEYTDRPDAVREMTERFTLALERIIRRHPEQYFWLHRRWKHEPPKRKSTQVAGLGGQLSNESGKIVEKVANCPRGAVVAGI